LFLPKMDFVVFTKRRFLRRFQTYKLTLPLEQILYA
jgi:hypothetical protein